MSDLRARLDASLSSTYRVERELGSGGMAVVWLAQDLRHNRRVALKVMRPELSAAMGPDRFLREIQIAAGLSHPHILPLHDSGVADGLLYYVMPFVEGESLRDRLARERQLPLEDALHFAREVADALSYAHNRGVVHRDIKPENILLSGGHALVADFGIAAAVDVAGGSRLTETGIAVGTPAYMSPEQSLGERTIDARADIYALGCVVYEMLAGETPFAAPTLQALLARQMRESAPSLRSVREAVPDSVDQTVTKALARLPADRFATAEQFSRALVTPSASVVSGGMVTAPARRARWIAVAAAVLALVAAGVVWRSNRSGEQTAQIGRLAVLPLVNGTGDTTVNAVAEALTQELISSLLSAGVRVIGYYSVAKYQGTSIPIGQVGKELNVDAVATWSVRRQGNQLQLSLEVARPQSGEGMWASTSYAVDSLRLPDIAAGAARELAERFAPRSQNSSAATLAAVDAHSAEAKIAYLLGMQAYYKGSAGSETAFSHFRRAIAVDANYAPAWAGLGLASAYAIDYARLPVKEACAQGKPAIERALALDSKLALAHLARARILQHCDWNWKEAEAEYLKAIAIEPSAIAYQSYGWLLEWYLGRTREGLAMGEKAVALDPGSMMMHMALAWRLRGAKELDRAEAEARLVIALDSGSADARSVLAEVNVQRGDYVAAEREARHLETSDRSAAHWSELGEIYARTGRVAEARRYMKLLTAERPQTGPARVALARVQLALGERDAALTTLESAVRDRIFIIPFQSYWDSIRNEPRFQAMMRTMGL